MLEVGRKLRLLREHLGIEQKDLAAHLGIKAAAMSHLETDKTPDTKGSTIALLAYVMGISAEYFYSNMLPEEFLKMQEEKPLAYMLSQLPSLEHWRKIITLEYNEYQIQKNNAEDKFRISAAVVAEISKRNNKQKLIVPIIKKKEKVSSK